MHFWKTRVKAPDYPYAGMLEFVFDEGQRLVKQLIYGDPLNASAAASESKHLPDYLGDSLCLLEGNLEEPPPGLRIIAVLHQKERVLD